MKSTKKFIIVFFFITNYLLLITNCSLAQVNNKGTDIVVPLSEITGTRRAVIIGISDYQNITKLNYAHSDAEAFFKYLTSKQGGSFDQQNIRFLLNENATQPKIWEAISWLVQESKEGDQAVFYFSGHGDVENTVMINQGFLLCSEVAKTNYMSAGVAVYMLQQALVQIASKKVNVLSIIDACHSGKLSGGIEGVSMTAKTLEENWTNVNKILSSQSGELSQEGNKWGGGAGVFTYTLIEGLIGLADENKDGKVTLYELERYLGDNVSKETGGAQFPVVSGDKKTIIALVDKNALSDLIKQKNDNKDNYTNLFASKGLDETSLADLDKEIKEKYEKIKLQIKDNKLIKPAGDNAWDLYTELSNDEKAKQLIPELRGMMIVALQEQANTIIKYYIDCNTARFKISITEAEDQLSKALELMGETHIIYNLVKSKQLFLLGSTEYYKKPDDAIKHLEESILLEPDAAHSYNMLGIIYLERKHDSVKAIANFKKAIEYAPKWAYPYSSLASVDLYAGRYTDALEYLNKAVELKPDFVGALNEIARCYNQLEDMQKSYEYLKLCLEYDDKDAVVYGNIGWVCLNLNKDSLAVNYFAKSLELKTQPLAQYSNYLSVSLGLSIAFYRIKNYNESQYYIEYVIKYVPELKKGMSGVPKLVENGLLFNDTEQKLLKSVLDYFGYK